MKKMLMGLMAAVLVGGVASSADATPITFNVGGLDDGSSVSVYETVYSASLTGSLVSGLDEQLFTLGDGETEVIDFFTLEASGFGAGFYTIEATLAFEQPDIDASGSGVGGFFTFLGFISGGTLDWQDSMPDVFTLSDGNTISIDFEEGCILKFGETTTIQASITNLGGGSSTAVPEPSTLLLLGGGLLGLAFAGRRKSRKQ